MHSAHIHRTQIAAPSRLVHSALELSPAPKFWESSQIWDLLGTRPEFLSLSEIILLNLFLIPRKYLELLQTKVNLLLGHMIKFWL